MLRRALVLFALLPAAAFAGTWRYALTPGSVSKFHYSGTDDVTVQMPMMGPMTQHLVVDTDYSVKVVKALPDGRADVELTLEKVVLKDSTGAATTLGKLPKDMQVMRAYLSPRGHFEFYKKVIVQVADDGHYALGSVTAGPTGGSASATVDGETVTATAAIDPKTGRVSASITRKAAPPPQPSTHEEERREPTTIDVLPAQVLSLMELPEGPVTPGEAFRIDLPSIRFEGKGLPGEPCKKATCSMLSMKSVVDGSNEATVKTAKAMGAPKAETAEMEQEMDHADQEMAQGMADMQGQMGGMMGMGGMGAMMGGGPKAARGGGMPKMMVALDATMAFDERAGALHRVAGNVESTMDAMGLKTVSKSVFTLQAR